VTLVWRAVDHTLQRNLLDGVLLLPTGVADPVHLNGSAAEIWALVDGQASVADVSRVLADRHQVPLAEVTPMVEQALRDLAATGALQPADDAPPAAEPDAEPAR
jgi:hypothetical protein